MKPISEELIEQTLEDLDQFTEKTAGKAMEAITNAQPELLSFVVEFTENLSPDARELAFYMVFVIYRTFQKGYEKEIQKIESNEIKKCYDKNENFLEKLEAAHEKFIRKIAETQLLQQPELMNFVVETLVEEAEDDEFEPLTDEEAGTLFFLMKIVVEVIELKTGA